MKMPNSLEKEKSTQDKKDLERFSKFFTYKVVQVIVQSRLGEKIKCCSRPTSSPSDWFNLCIDDNPEILKHTKAALSSNSLPNPPVLIEISLKTSDSKTLPLELWNLNFQEFEIEQNIRILYTVYNRMSLLLKSLISVTRVVPAYKLSRVRGGDYQIHYSVYSGNPDYGLLGRECKIIKLGSVGTPFGSICLEFGYRTKMELSIESIPVLIKSDHYSIDSSSQLSGLAAAFRSGGSGPGVNNQANINNNTIATDVPLTNKQQQIPPVPKIPAFSEPLNLPSEEVETGDMPFGNLLKKSLYKSSTLSSSPQGPPGITINTPLPQILEEDKSSSYTNSDGSNISTAATNAAPQGFEFVNVKPPPFAPAVDPSTDAASLFSTLKNPPQLDSFETPITSSSSPTIDIEKQIASFEENLEVFDEFVKKLCFESS